MIRFDFLKGYRTLAAAVAAIAGGVVFLVDGNTAGGIQSIALGLGMLGIRYK